MHQVRFVVRIAYQVIMINVAVFLFFFLFILYAGMGRHFDFGDKWIVFVAHT